MELKNSKTKENLMKAFAGESQARNRYTSPFVFFLFKTKSALFEQDAFRINLRNAL